MRPILSSIAAGMLLTVVAVAQPQPHYRITDLGPQSSPFSQATAINNGAPLISPSSVRRNLAEQGIQEIRALFIQLV